MKKTIYKFFRVNQYLYDTLISNQLYFSSIKQFNDPYDSHLAVLEKISEEDLIAYLESSIPPNEIEEAKAKYIPAFRKKHDEFVKLFLDMYKDWLHYVGICCFSKGKQNLLLWSHYADSHRGICLGFDYELMIKKFPQFGDVTYKDDLHHFDLKNPMGSISQTLIRKSSDWHYEDEIRFLMERNKNVDFFQEALLEVNFGARCNLRDMTNIQYLISKLGYPNCKFYQAVINDKKYIVDFVDSDFEDLKAKALKESEEIRFKKDTSFAHLLEE